MKSSMTMLVASLALAACQTGGPDALIDPYDKQPVNDYYFGTPNQTDSDPDFLYGQDIDGAG